MTINNELINTSDPAINIYSSIKNQEHKFYSFLKDFKGNCLSFNYNNSYSPKPLSGFNNSLPTEWKVIIKQIIEREDYFSANQGIMDEYIETVDSGGNQFDFLITKIPFDLGDTMYSHFVIRENEPRLIDEVNFRKVNTKCISSISHDLRTPLSIIYANLQLLEHHQDQLDKETKEDTFLLSRMAVKSLMRILDKVSIIDSMNKKRLELKPVKVDLLSICLGLVKELNDMEINPDRIEYKHDDNIGEVEIDKYLFKHLFTNLILNALDFSRKNLKVRFESTVRDSNTIRFMIKDDGIGLSNNQLMDLNTFFNSAKSELVQGIGLGFVIAKECLILQHGKLSIESEVGNGSTFIVDLSIKVSGENNSRNEQAY